MKLYPVYININKNLFPAQQYIFKIERFRDYFIEEMRKICPDITITIPENEYGLELLTWSVENTHELINEFKNNVEPKEQK